MDDSGDETPDPEAEAAATIRARSRHALSLCISHAFTPRSLQWIPEVAHLRVLWHLSMPYHSREACRASLACLLSPALSAPPR